VSVLSQSAQWMTGGNPLLFTSWLCTLGTACINNSGLMNIKHHAMTSTEVRITLQDVFRLLIGKTLHKSGIKLSIGVDIPS
jgi:hypothetical protein